VHAALIGCRERRGETKSSLTVLQHRPWTNLGEVIMSRSIQEPAQSVDLGFPIFLTAYDPSDLPGSSLDPMGFERGYLFLADKILPGLTNVADRPRYFSVLCTGALLAGVDPADSPRSQYQKRLDHILRLERCWALANVLASQEQHDGELSASGIRGVTYASAKADSLVRAGAARTDANFQLLSRQVPYGVVGIYGAVADGMRLIDRKTLALTPDLGERLGEGFIQETSVPKALIKAVQSDTKIALDELAQWGRRSHLAGQRVECERKYLADALHRDPVRSRMAEALAGHPFQGQDDTELKRLKRLLPALEREGGNCDLAEAVQTILAYEAAYRLAMLGFERLLWRCRESPSGTIEAADIASDPVLERVRDGLPAAVQSLGNALDSAESDQFRQDLHRLEDTRRFLGQASSACKATASLVHELMERHADVQRGKFDKGRRKMPWIEVAAGRISLTMTRVGGLSREAADPAEITPHPYRLSSADALNKVARGA
jgi:hypothetical protein